ncbi:hypothetical protein AB0F88_21385 [Streptosporangium sp. NPDC023963]
MSAPIGSTAMKPVYSLFSWFRETLNPQPVTREGDHGVQGRYPEC